VSKRARIQAYGCAGVLVVIGVVIGVATGGTVGQVVALVLVSLGLVLATSLVFLEVGLSEDRERAREATAQEQPRKLLRRPRARLDRMRGRHRRLK
jgi:hypothetical protein